MLQPLICEVAILELVSPEQGLQPVRMSDMESAHGRDPKREHAGSRRQRD